VHSVSAADKPGNGKSLAPSPFADPDNRAHQGQAKIKSRLIAYLDPDEWDLPPKPKWMRWRTYDRYVERYDAYEAILDYGIYELVAKLLSSRASYCSMSSSARLMPKCAGTFAAGCAKRASGRPLQAFGSCSLRVKHQARPCTHKRASVETLRGTSALPSIADVRRTQSTSPLCAISRRLETSEGARNESGKYA
jgi:hypothetical protein